MLADGSHVVLAGYYPPPFAGEPVHVKQLAECLRERGMSVEVINLRSSAPPSDEYRRATGRLSLLALLFRMAERASILHLHTNGHNWKSWVLIAAASLVTRLRGTASILTFHSGLLPGFVTRFGHLRSGAARSALSSFARIVCVNQEIAKALKDLGVDEARLRVIPAFLGVPPRAELSSAGDPAIDRFRPLVVTVAGGDDDPELGLPTVVHALRDLIASFPDLGIAFVGWKVGPKLTPLIHQLGLEGRAVVLGEVPHERCLALLGRADAVVRSTFADGDAITVREALALGVPIVASNTDFRPPGVVLFEKGDSADLVRKLTEVLRGNQSANVVDATEVSRNGEELWRVYREAAGIEG